jgi:hypothetical protein
MTHAEIINKWPTLSDFADDLGVQYGTAKAMRRRSSIPSEHWLTVIAKAGDRDIDGISLEVLAAAVAKIPEAAE